MNNTKIKVKWVPKDTSLDYAIPAAQPQLKKELLLHQANSSSKSLRYYGQAIKNAIQSLNKVSTYYPQANIIRPVRGLVHWTMSNVQCLGFHLRVCPEF